LDAATERGILVVNAPGRNSIAVAELTVGLMLSLARRIPQADAFIKTGRWDDPVGGYLGFRGVELAGKTAGIVGLGAIGRMVAQRLAAFDMRLAAHDPYIARDRLGGLPVELLPLDDVLARADYLLVHVPASEATMGMIGEAQLARMKRSACLINASAPGVVNEEALTAALQAHRIAGAALDVFEGQPLPESSPLPTLPNVVLTPHIGGSTLETIDRQSAMIAEDILLTVAGKRPVRLVNAAAWDRRRSPSTP
ncbi:MAG: phosphoglycerate dehydrogenase, partial [Chloroflexi bacterium]|nr:phosphoglycerate dehydrogenase [Chloroflexota bacterium]